MKDLDFDELDKAVNSLMAGVPKTPVSSGEAPEKTVDIPSTAAVTEAPSSPALTPAPARPTPLSAPASRRSGRFMDVVHPSSAMKKPEPSRSVSRQGVTLEPSVELGADATPSPESKAPIATSRPASPETPAGTLETLREAPAQKSDWPDPPDMANFAESEDDKPKKPEPKSAVVEPSLPFKTDEVATETPLVSPFLPDTKVEKRPLGGNTPEPSLGVADKTTEATEDLPILSNDDQLPATADDVKPLLPEELHSDLVAIESDATGSSDKTDDTPTLEKADAPWVAPKEDAKKEATPETPLQEQKPEVKEEKPVTPVGPASIPQQYREEPSTGDQKNGAIYDTDNYHQPLAHPAKQKSGWMWIVWILVILVVGAGGGAAAYFLGLV